jgi:glycosyltransferase involved in cell wall biosynthesis
MKIAVVHDYFTQMGGAEKVTEELVRLVPDATLFSTVALPDKMPSGLQGRPVVTSWMQHLPMLKKYYRLYFLLYPWAVSSLDVSDYSLVLSSSSGYAKGISTARDAIHICYCHTPMRWAWSFDSYSKREGFGSGRRFVLSHLVAALRGWDIGASRQPDHFIANSKMVAARILRAYNRVAEVIYPPIDIDRFHISTQLDDYYLVLSRLVSYKRIDLAVRACSSLGRKLLVIGDGPDLARLKALAGPTVIFAGRLPDSQVEYHAARCKALLFPGEEDFGMAPVEVAAAGRPSIAFRAGGAVESIVEGVTGIFFDRREPEDLMAAIESFERLEWSSLALRSHAETFSIPVFQSNMRSFLTRVGAALPERAAFNCDPPLAHARSVVRPAHPVGETATA